MIEPVSEAQLSEAVKDAGGPLRIRGGGTRPIGNPATGEVLSTAKLSGITLYEPGALTLVARAGTPMDEIGAALASESQRLPFEPMDHRVLMGTDGEPTIGGVVAANASGPRRIKEGACRDSLIGVRFCDGRGTVLKNGGRVMKNVTGYDLVKLMAGSYGTLGVLSEVSFKLLPATNRRGCIMIHGQSIPQAVASMSKALGSPFEVSAAAYDPNGVNGPVTMLRLEGFDGSVKYRAEKVAALLAGDGDTTTETDPDAVSALWRDIRDCKPLSGHDADIWRVSVKPSDAQTLIDALGEAKVLLDWGGGLVYVACTPGTNLRDIAPEIAGHRTLIKASDATKTQLGVFHPEPAPLQQISNGLRARFDPRGILNAGLMG